MRRIIARIYLFLYRWNTAIPEMEVPDRCVMIAAPHTSNWDFPVTMAMAEVSGVPIRWLGKSQMFKGPLAPIFRWMGGISVERSNARGLVEDLAAQFAEHDRLVLVVPAEGTRSAVEYWKSGFYRIAQLADVPIVCAFVDKRTRTGGFGLVLDPSDDVSADMDKVREFYADKTGLKPGRFNVPKLREEESVTDPS
jgi:1-acyl-sn-glycerol-3-phosphate acyltransferase